MKPTAAAVLTAIDQALDAAHDARHAAVMADIPMLEPIPGQFDTDDVLNHHDAPRDPFEVDGIVYDFMKDVVDSPRPMFDVLDDSPATLCRMVRMAFDDAEPVGDLVDDELSGWPVYRYADEQWVW